jgi:hypothetical protein
MRLLALVLGCALVLVLPAPADACSCGGGSSDLPTTLRAARADAEAIFHARVVSVEPRWSLLGLVGLGSSGLEAHLEILEVFKGTVGPRLVMHTGPSIGDCTFPFEAGVEYLVYAFKHEGRLRTGICQRTRPAAKDDSELEWLRTGRLPPVPEALQREVVQCTPCTLETVAERLVGPPPGNACNMSVWPQEVAQALKDGRPFWHGGYYDYDDPSRTTALGISLDSRAFELVQTPHHGTEETCRQRVTRKWCERLEPAPPSERNVPDLRCVNPGPEEEVCDEEKSRTASWAPREPLQAATCRWYTPDRPSCQLEKTLQPRAVETSVPWLLMCRPAYERSYAHACQVVPGSGPRLP